MALSLWAALEAVSSKTALRSESKAHDPLCVELIDLWFPGGKSTEAKAIGPLTSSSRKAIHNQWAIWNTCYWIYLRRVALTTPDHYFFSKTNDSFNFLEKTWHKINALYLHNNILIDFFIFRLIKDDMIVLDIWGWED